MQWLVYSPYRIDDYTNVCTGEEFEEAYGNLQNPRVRAIAPRIWARFDNESEALEHSKWLNDITRESYSN